MSNLQKVLSDILHELRGHKAALSIQEFADYIGVSKRSAYRFLDAHPEIDKIKEKGIGLRVIMSSYNDYIMSQAKRGKEDRESDENHVRSLLSHAGLN